MGAPLKPAVKLGVIVIVIGAIGGGFFFVNSHNPKPTASIPVTTQDAPVVAPIAKEVVAPTPEAKETPKEVAVAPKHKKHVENKHVVAKHHTPSISGSTSSTPHKVSEEDAMKELLKTGEKM